MNIQTSVSQDELADRQLKLLRRRARELAARVKAGELEFIAAVDCAFDAAAASGMLESIPSYLLPGGFIVTGADLVQVVLCECFAGARRPA
jgi:hypothetical protein